MTGPLFKQAIGKSMRSSFGKGGEKKRWFKLQGGELRYYAKDDLRPNSLKGTVPLAGCNISLNEKEPRCFSVELPDGKVLVVRGESDKEVQRWVSALTDTLDMMNKNEKHQPGKRRHRILISEDSNASGSGGHKTHNVVEKEQSTKDALVTALEQHFLFKKVGDLTEVIDSLHPVYFMSGDVICWQGDPGELFFCLEHGKAEVIINGASVATLHHGSAFGELALIHNVPRAATIRSVTNCQLWAVDRVTFRTLLASTASHSRDEKVAALRNVSLFQNLNDAAIDRISDALQIVTFASGDYIIKQGDLGDRFYVVKSGEVIVTQSSSGGYENELTRCQVGDYFGEIALMQDEPRKANVKALSPTVECYSLDRASFTSMMGSLKTVLEKNTSIQLLKGVHLLKGLSAEELEKVAAAVQHREYRCALACCVGPGTVHACDATVISPDLHQYLSDGDEIIRQGDKGNDFFIIQEGVVMVQVNGEVVTELGSGAYFGELALLSNQRRAATVIAKGNAVLKSLDRAVTLLQYAYSPSMVRPVHFIETLPSTRRPPPGAPHPLHSPRCHPRTSTGCWAHLKA
jgi:CRP-like cAMP-binding protein